MTPRLSLSRSLQRKPVTFKMKKNKSILPIRNESAEQKSVVVWWSLVCASHNLNENILMACPAQAARTPQGGARIRAEGYRSGTPDLFLAVGRKGLHGLHIEMKRTTGGTLSETQKEMLFLLNEQGYKTAVAHGADQARKIITEYLTQ